MQPIVDPLHHTSFPDWLEDGFANRDFPFLYCRFMREFAERYPWVRQYIAQERQFAMHDLVLGRIDSSHPMHRYLVENGAAPDDLDRGSSDRHTGARLLLPLRNRVVLGMRTRPRKHQPLESTPKVLRR
jgi:hypothetical protein